MKASFTDFKLSLGITSQDRDTEYANILKGLIKELYTVYGIALSKDILSHTETKTLHFDTAISLAYKNIVTISIDGFIQDTDYTVDLKEGTVTILSTGSMTDNTDYSIVYDYYLFINESNEVIYKIYPDSTTKIYTIDIKPFTLLKVKYNGNTLIEDTDYYIYDNKFEIVSIPTNLRKPLELHLEVGYEIIPNDLKYAFYELAGIRFDMKDKKTYLIDRITDNSQGATTVFNKDSFPNHIKQILLSYTGRRFFI
jgi:hypothetical protein